MTRVFIVSLDFPEVDSLISDLPWMSNAEREAA
jgi:hypothetical protein